MSRFIRLLCLPVLAMLIVAAGCKDKDEATYDQVGEVRVYEAPRRKNEKQARLESVPAPAPIASEKASPNSRKTAKQPQHHNIGEMIPD